MHKVIVFGAMITGAYVQQCVKGFGTSLALPRRLCRSPARCSSSAVVQEIAALSPEDVAGHEKGAAQLADFLRGSRRVVALTGAGISTESGIPDYRGPHGSYSRGHKPMTHDEFINSGHHRARYWARFTVGYRRFSGAKPNQGHYALARMEGELQLVETVITQNVDGLHQQAGSESVMDLHGRNDRVICISCEYKTPRRMFQKVLEDMNAEWIARNVGRQDPQMFADGDVDFTGVDFNSFRVSACPSCGGILKPDVVFFGDVVPSAKVQEAFARVAAADALLVAGTSLMVYSGFRFVAAAHKANIPIAIVNKGSITRAQRDRIPHLNIEGMCGPILSKAVEKLHQ